jgi:hypothetical protein
MVCPTRTTAAATAAARPTAPDTDGDGVPNLTDGDDGGDGMPDVDSDDLRANAGEDRMARHHQRARR